MKNTLLFLFLAILSLHTQAQNASKFQPEKGMVALDMLKGKADLKVGQKAYLQYKRYSSVGIGGWATVEHEAILKVISSQTDADRTHTEGMTGDDEATVTVVFEAVKKGKTNITHQAHFRGKVQSSYKIKISVK